MTNGIPFEGKLFRTLCTTTLWQSANTRDFDKVGYLHEGDVFFVVSDVSQLQMKSFLNPLGDVYRRGDNAHNAMQSCLQVCTRLGVGFLWIHSDKAEVIL